eukprot:1332660-Amorphochlora_amoeboformis.AAC.1
MGDAVGSKCFSSHLADEHSSENLSFYRAVLNYKSAFDKEVTVSANLPKFSPHNLQDMPHIVTLTLMCVCQPLRVREIAKSIYWQYISERGVLHVNIEGKFRIAIRYTLRERGNAYTLSKFVTD